MERVQFTLNVVGPVSSEKRNGAGMERQQFTLDVVGPVNLDKVHVLVALIFA